MNKGAALIILFVFCAINLDSAFAATQSPTELTGFDPDPVPLNYCINNCSFIGVCYPVHHGETCKFFLCRLFYWLPSVLLIHPLPLNT